MLVQSDILGPLTVQEDQILRFPNGLFGLPDCRSFVLLPAEREGLYWLQSAEHSALAFVLVDPFLAFEGYAVEVGPGDLAELEARDASEVAILAIVTLPGPPTEPATANLQGPIALNLNSGWAKQIVVQDTEFGVRCPFDLQAVAGA